MKLPLLFFLLAPIFLPGSFAQESSLESKIQIADSLWKSKRLNEAIKQYQLVIQKEPIPEEYQSLVYLRLAKAQFEAKQIKDCRLTLAKAKALPILPTHHQLIIKEMGEKLNGIPTSEHTSLPSGLKPVASLYVLSNSGEKTNSSSQRAVYPSLKQALDAARIILQKSALPKGPIEIIIEGDTYPLFEPIRLSPENSGTRQNPFVIRSSKAGKNVIIDGGMALKIWQRETNPEVLARLPENARQKVWVADLKENMVQGIDSLVFGGFSSKRAAGSNALFKTFSIPELFDQGNPQQMARWPNDKDTIIALKDFKDHRIFRWASDDDVWLHGYWYYLWADAYEKMAGISSKDSTISVSSPVNRYGFGKSKWHVVNALSELDTPGEWCISIKKGKIWYIPHNDAHPGNMVLSTIGPAILAENCNYLTVKGLDFQFIRGDGILFTNCSHLTLAGCSVRNCSGLGIRINGGNSHLVHSCTIESMGRSGIEIDAGDKLKLIHSGSIIENCKISNLSRIDRTYTPAILLQGAGIMVRQCHFFDIPSSAIRLEGNDMLVEKNEFSKCVTESDDQGAIDVFGNPLYRGNIIRWNFFHDIGIPHLHMAAGVRLDDAISGFSIYENLFLRASNDLFGGIQIHGGKDNFIEGNIFADCHAAISQTPWGDKRWQEAIDNPDHPMYKAMHTTDWQSEFWQHRYPALKHLLTDPNRNYATDNVAINAETFILRKSERFEILNNKLLKADNHPATAKDFTDYLVPWHLIPVDKIGLYGN